MFVCVWVGEGGGGGGGANICRWLDNTSICPQKRLNFMSIIFFNGDALTTDFALFLIGSNILESLKQ